MGLRCRGLGEKSVPGKLAGMKGKPLLTAKSLSANLVYHSFAFYFSATRARTSAINEVPQQDNRMNAFADRSGSLLAALRCAPALRPVGMYGEEPRLYVP